MGMGYLALPNILYLGAGVRETIRDPSMNYTFTVPLILLVAASTVSIIGLARKAVWVRVVIFVTIGVGILMSLGPTAYHIFTTPEEVVPSIISAAILNIPLLFLAYKIYTSEPLKIYLSNEKK